MKIEQNISYFVLHNKAMYMRIGPKEWCLGASTGWINVSDYVSQDLEYKFQEQLIKDFNSDKNA